MRIHTSAPTRIDLAGGTIDIWPLYLFHDRAQTLNVAISLRAHATIESREAGGIAIRSVDTGHECVVDEPGQLPTTGPLGLLGLLLRFFGVCKVSLTTRAESPAGAGIAGSSALNVAVCAALNRWTGAGYDDEALLQVALNVEAQAIAVPTGAQDYRPALYGGVAAIELGASGVRRVALDVDTDELEKRIVLVYTGAPRNSGTNNWEITKRHIDGDREVFECFDRIRDTAVLMRNALARGAWDEVGWQVAAEWENRKRLAPGVTTPHIEELIAGARKAGAQAAKVCGAGGGGCLFCYTPPEAASRVRDALARAGASLLDYRIEREGLVFE